MRMGNYHFSRLRNNLEIGDLLKRYWVDPGKREILLLLGSETERVYPGFPECIGSPPRDIEKTERTRFLAK